MAVGTTQVTNFETAVDGTAYKTSIDNNIAVVKEIGALFAVSETTPPSMGVFIQAGRLFVNGVLLTTTTRGATMAAPTTNPRIDRVVKRDLDGEPLAVTGTAAPSPVPPAIPIGYSTLARVALTVGMTVITNANITDERIGGGGSSSVTEAAFAVSIDTGESKNSMGRFYIAANTINQIVVALSVVGSSGGTGGKFGSPASTTTAGQLFTVNHNLGAIKMVTISLNITSGTGNPFTGTATIQYQ